MHPSVIIYSKDTCPFCFAAKALLSHKAVNVTTIDIADAPEKRQEMIQRSGGRTTVPQIFIGGFHVGSYTDLAALNTAAGSTRCCAPRAQVRPIRI